MLSSRLVKFAGCCPAETTVTFTVAFTIACMTIGIEVVLVVFVDSEDVMRSGGLSGGSISNSCSLEDSSSINGGKVSVGLIVLA